MSDRFPGGPDDVVLASFPEAGAGRRFPTWLGPSSETVHRVEFPGPNTGAAPRLFDLAGGLVPYRTPPEPEPEPVVHGPPMPPHEVQAANALLAARIEAVGAAAGAFVTARDEVLRQSQDAVLEVAVTLAETLVEGALEHDPALHGALARRALETLAAPANEARLRASRDTYATLVDVFGEPNVPWGPDRVPVVLDTSLEGTGCVAETDDAQSDGRVESVIAAARRALREERRRHVDDAAEDGEVEP